MTTQDALDRISDMAHEAHLEFLRATGRKHLEDMRVASARQDALLDALSIVRKIHAEESSHAH